MRFGILIPRAISLRSFKMSKIVDLALEIEKELEKIHDENTFLTSQLDRANDKNKKIVQMIKDFLYDVQEVMDNE